ncbi:hypothetical protein OIO07_00870 [Bacillus paralicheniformis]|jgi:flagellar basal body-associated protein FliL|uniref:Uncharacterized protein n=2 Tax=Bacillus TaxID=1386 RepID=A0A6I7TVR9_9BACI|nr:MULTISPECIES: hypothetical protein [Bacillus]ETB70190.1 hypothetical protein A943_14935 [Bacillus sp. CPSM8]KUL14183.1 hypothetical protein LI7559_03565 [Bacillus licheniformis LMG 7559]MBC8621925.1 hypothetical protein [Robertmurraya crescens]TWK21508.1 hypothetical protein CHCC20375_4270 [Bacillus licheniformis]AGN38510.1 hypothetical protein BaLi_c41980 [Bacillus paralicheniformis ATCC 9945a]
MMMFILILTMAVYLFYSFSKDNRPAKRNNKNHQTLTVIRENPFTAPSNDVNC